MKKQRIIFWVATGILVLWEGVMPLSTILFAPEYVNAGTKPLGYPDYFAYTLIICKVLGVLAISYPKTPARLKEWAYAGLTFNLIFAFISHACVDRNIGFMLMPLVVLGILAVSYMANNKIQQKGSGELSHHRMPAAKHQMVKG
ncbi:DoxX family protein [Pontibacter sp. SGAir0037]|uniref:DoxX family protein n=1 Tax=Pontibacter sp. SGAir0037 TaxID=2571030 RepID=UPI0010CCFB5C|nr:DoxX family protein [Pontibacter sp. SGAir0037]QCR24978.1 DoxX family protein [Pontibacter sp. SGAir0037]